MITKGQKINDRYEIIKSIGEGGMANVYLGYDEILDRDVAVKVLRGDLSNDEKFVRRFQREALSASSLSHPNIVEMYDVGEDNGLYYIVMEYVEGKTLKQLLKRRGNLTLSEAIDIMLQLTDGMAHAHDSYIIHRDLKPQNIMIQDDGQVKITDFGIAMALNSTQLTQTNSVMGSVHYLPPEQASGKGSTIKSDIYSLGIIFYELLTGKLPFKGDNAVEIALKHMRDPIPSLKEDNPNIPQSIENTILKATAKNPKNRYDDAKSMHDDLLTVLDEERMDEAPLVYKYPEHESENTKRIRKLEELENETEDDQIAEKINDEDQRDKKNKRIIIILSCILGALILIFTTIFFIIPHFTKVKTVTVPSVKGLTVSKATDKLEDLGLEVNTKIKTVSDKKVDKGRIVKTDPQKGKVVKVGSKITLYKSSGEKTYKLDDYTGKNYIEVQTILETKYKLDVTIEKKDVTDANVEEDTIIGQSLAKGSEVKQGDSITLYIPNIIELMPDMVSEEYSYDEAVAFCKKYGLIIKANYVETSAYPVGRVISQSLRAGSTIVKDSTLTVDIAAKPTDKKDNNTDNTTNNNDNNSSNNNGSTTNPPVDGSP
ncbi:MAG: Stk1 family PASTA domain-containing Ser/Thr kinase [Bacilli bacterium]|nr:Stk1 family PASTA domain-containing Ser/Thr kinase [Bacilli bacterium]